MEIDVRLELEDNLRASYWFLFHKPLVRVVVGFAALLTPFLVHAWITGKNVGLFPALLPIAVLLMIVGTYFGVRRSMATNKSLQESFHYSFTPVGIDAVAPSSSGHTRWENILNAFEITRSFLLFISNNQMYVIPKRFFRDAQQVTAFKQLLVSHLGAKAKLKE